MIDRLLTGAVLGLLGLVRLVILVDPRTYMVFGAGPVQPLLARIGRMRARAVFLKARARCPAYRRFLEEQGYSGKGRWELETIPVMTKENYVRKYSIEERCYNGRLPRAGVVIDESSGSSGVPNNWVRSAGERADVRHILQLNYRALYRDRCCILLNCFALGPWATGMNVSMSLVDVGILKSIGPDVQKLENTLEIFGTGYHYLVFGYPPFVKSFVDGTRLDLSAYRMDVIVGGEGISEGLRAHLSRSFQSVISSYGASDLEINIGIETPLTVELRRRCVADRNLARKLFGREAAPMIFQYNALDYVIETNAEGELLFTIGRRTGAAPKIRYNLKDCGGVMSWKDVTGGLSREGVKLNTPANRQSRFPILYVFGRADLAVPFYGAKISPSDVEDVLGGEKELVERIHSFQIESYEDESLNRRLRIHLEAAAGRAGDLPPRETLRDLLFDGLARCNQDFREVTRMFERNCVEVVVHEFETGPFRDRDIRVKNRYIGKT